MHMLRRGNRNPLIWNIACDYAINHIVIDAGLTLPSDALYEAKYRNWLVDAIYDDRINNRPELPQRVTMGRPSAEGPDSPGDSDQQPNQPAKGKAKQSLWGTVTEPKNDDGTAMSDAEQQELKEDIKIKVVQAAQAAKSVGKLPVALEGLIKAVGKPSINWKEYIQSWVSGKVPDDYTWRKLNRRMLGLYNILAPSMQLNGCGIGVVSIDTSGSVSDKELVRYVTEVVGVVEICNPDKLYIIQHDAVVHRVDVWEQGDDFKELKITHRGGTRIKPSFEEVKKLDEEVNWMICFTDMEIADYPSAKDAPDFPVLWAATGEDNAPFGTYLSLRDPIAAVS
jgi:predicted metal-dependent peptidase